MVLTSELGGVWSERRPAMEEEIQAELWGPPTATGTNQLPDPLPGQGRLGTELGTERGAKTQEAAESGP